MIGSALLTDNASFSSHPVGFSIALTAAGLTTLWLTRLTWSYWADCALAASLGLPKRQKDNIFLKGVYKPVDEEVNVQGLQVTGQIPLSLNGVFCRVGPNPYFKPIGDYHIFDGDGMIFACRISNGAVSFSNSYVDTNRLKQEKAAGHPLGLKIGDLRGLGGLLELAWHQLEIKLGVYNVKDGFGTANTALIYHANKLLVLHEGDLPYAVRALCNGVIETMGRVNYEGKIKHPFTAHPKIDPQTGELFFFGYNVSKHPHVIYKVADPAGHIQSSVPITIPHGVMMHDFAITQDYAIFLDCPLVFKPDEMVKKRTLPFVFDESQPTRFGILPRYAQKEDAMRWFEVPAVMMFHVANAWQDGNEVKLFSCCFDQFSLDVTEANNKAKANQTASQQRLREFTFNMDTGAVSQRVVSNVFGDFPSIPRHLAGRCTRYTYLAVMEWQGEEPVFVGVHKVDMQCESEEAANAGIILYGSNVVGGEAFFVPSHQDPADCDGEDDGHLVTFTQNSKDGASEMRVYDAKTMSHKPVARVQLPLRCPSGFHCYHMSEEQFQEQAGML
ncbi:hypothetical protein WJX77_000411 [Trebouxia sp. C0004]